MLIPKYFLPIYIAIVCLYMVSCTNGSSATPRSEGTRIGSGYFEPEEIVETKEIPQNCADGEELDENLKVKSQWVKNYSAIDYLGELMSYQTREEILEINNRKLRTKVTVTHTNRIEGIKTGYEYIQSCRYGSTNNWRSSCIIYDSKQSGDSMWALADQSNFYSDRRKCTIEAAKTTGESSTNAQPSNEVKVTRGSYTFLNGTRVVAFKNVTSEAPGEVTCDGKPLGQGFARTITIYSPSASDSKGLKCGANILGRHEVIVDGEAVSQYSEEYQAINY